MTLLLLLQPARGARHAGILLFPHIFHATTAEKMMMGKKLFMFFFVASLCSVASGKIHQLVIENDDRKLFSIETFGFVSGGHVFMTVKNFEITPKPASKFGFVFLKVGRCFYFSYESQLTHAGRLTTKQTRIT